MRELIEVYGESLIAVFSFGIFLGVMGIFLIEPIKEAVLGFVGVFG